MSTQRLTVAELAERWDRPAQWVRQHAKAKKIPGAFKVGAFWRFPVEAIERYEQRNAVADPMSMTELSAQRQAS